MLTKGDESMNDIQKINAIRNATISEVNAILAKANRKIENISGIKDSFPIENKFSICIEPAFFKGTKPSAVCFGKERIEVKKWNEVYTLVLEKCVADKLNYYKLLSLRNKILGRERILVSDSPKRLKRPFKLGEDLFVEIKYASDTLMHILINRILDELDFDYSDIFVELK